jgi:uncharacterized membrane protein YqiK
MDIGHILTAYGIPVVIIVIALVALKFGFNFILLLLGIVSVPEDSTAIVTKRWAWNGKSVPAGHIIALNSEAGYQADMLGPGLYFGYFAWQFSVKLQKFTSVPQGKIGIVEAIDGSPMDPGRVLASAQVECDSFQDARAFLSKGGQRGPQSDIIKPGSYRINTALFKVTVVDAVQIDDNEIGIVTVKDGAPLDTGEIAGPIVQGHDRFQNGRAFIAAGGKKGLQEDVLLAGTHFINPYFATVERQSLYEVPIGYCGVVVSYVGESPPDSLPNAAPGTGILHGRIVEKFQKGVWREPYDPGKYPINRKTHFIELVPTTNTVLNWAERKSEAHKLDEKLSTITVRSKDGFEFNIDVSQIIHVSRDRASAVIARFGSMQNLVTQVLEPIIDNYFRNSAQSSDAIDFLMTRTERQAEARKAIEAAISGHDVQPVDTLINNINPPAELMETLTAKKVAERQVETFKAQKDAQIARTELEQTTAEADTRGQVVQASRDLEVAEYTAQSVAKRAEGEGKAKVTLAEAEAKATTLVGEAQAGVIEKVGNAEAAVQKAKVESIGPQQYAAIQIAGAFATNKIALVPEIQVTGSGGEKGGGNGIVDAFIGMTLRQNLDEKRNPGEPTPAPTPASTPAPAEPPQEPAAPE